MHTNTAPLDPRIGILNSGVFYAFVNGYSKPETRGTREEVEAALGLRSEIVVPAAAAKPARRRELHAYEVTTTLSQTVYFQGGEISSDVSTIYAYTKAEAISKAKAAYREAEGRYRVPATFTARRAD